MSADTHIVSGSITFGVRQSAAATSAEPTTHLSDLDVVSDVGQGATYLGAAHAFGTVAVCVLLWPDALSGRRRRMLGRAGWTMLVLGSLAELLLEGPRAVDTGWSGVVRLNDIGQTSHTEYAVALVVRLVLLAALPAVAAHRAPSLWRAKGAEPLAPRTTVADDSRWRMACTAAGAVAVLVTIAMGGHAAVGSDRYFALVGDRLLHRLHKHSANGAPIRADRVRPRHHDPRGHHSAGPATQLTAPLGPDRLVVKTGSTRRDPQQISLTAVDDSGRPVRLQSLTGSLSSPAAGLAALNLKLVRGPGLRWHSVAAVAEAAVWLLPAGR